LLEEPGCLLFERIGKRKLRLTVAGEKLLEFAESVLKEYNSVIEEINQLKGFPKGDLKIAAPFTTLYHLLPGTLKAYLDQFSWVELTLLDRSQQNVIEMVREGDVDFGLAIEAAVPKDLAVLRWLEVETVLLVPKGHPLAGERQVSMWQIAQYPLILPPRGAEFAARRKLEEIFHTLGVSYRIVMESSNVELSSVYTELGFGISFATLARNFPRLKRRNLEFVSLNHYFEPGYIGVVMRKDKVLPPYKKAFIDFLLNNPRANSR